MRSAAQKSYQEDITPIVEPVMAPTTTLVRRLPSLDGLRGLAVIEVFLYHARTPSKNSGWIGVELFLAISGFVITRSLLSEWFETGKISIWNFIKRRVARIYPALIFLILTYVVLGALIFRRGFYKLSAEVIPSFFGFANWTRAYHFKFPKDLGHLWSLSVELQLYLVWAPIVVFLLRGSLKNLILGTLAIALTFCAYRYYLTASGSSSVFIYNNTVCRALPFLLGATGAALAAKNLALKDFSKVIKALAIITFLAALTYHLYELRYCSLSQWGKRNWNSLWISLSAAIIVWGVSAQVIPAISKFFSTRVMYYLGSISYGAFLWHYPIILLFPRGDANLRFVTAIILSLVMGAISFELVEKRFLRSNKN
jgi:peptidoglycan/LPS O-acetylase OafA/YrhL